MFGRKARRIAHLEHTIAERARLAREAIDFRDGLLDEAKRELAKAHEWGEHQAEQLETLADERDDAVARIAQVSSYDLVISINTMPDGSTGFGLPARVDELVRAPLDVLASIVAGSDSPEGRSLLSGSYRGRPLPQLVYDEATPGAMRMIDVALWQRPAPHALMREIDASGGPWAGTLLEDEDDRDEPEADDDA